MRFLTALTILTATSTITAAEDWARVRALKSGTEIRIHQKGVDKPVHAKMDEADADRILVVVKNEQRAIARDEIDRIDARPGAPVARITNDTKATTGSEESRKTMRTPLERPRTGSLSSGVSIGGKPDFEVVYRRPPGQ